jgi:glyoxylase-like metal-dependent hydrolase (beta-lactamase superfamily II)
MGDEQVPVPFFLIRHADGDVIVDGGNPIAVAGDLPTHWGALAEGVELYMSEGQHCVPQLSRLGIGRGSVRYVVQTHLHVDHTGALGHFPDAEIVVHARELEAARVSESPLETAYVHADFDLPGLRWRPAEGELDLFGDGTVRLIESPGHSAGHMSVLVRLPATGPVLLTGDASDNRAQWEGLAEPRAYWSAEQAAQSLAELRELAAETGSLVVFGHDPRNWLTLTRAPGSYR